MKSYMIGWYEIMKCMMKKMMYDEMRWGNEMKWDVM